MLVTKVTTQIESFILIDYAIDFIAFDLRRIIITQPHSTFKKKAPKAIKEIKKFAQIAMGTTGVRVDVKLNKYVWSRGIRRIRVCIVHKRNDDEDAKEELYSLVTVAEIPAEGLKGLGTKIIDDED
ncbi:hypothetical protein L1987_64591 [Smallanthus sonchifolius]|uniref:Uncharacterized protein n=1 Tax=Smallanthus sonchifolius TaxID=185202 RepID=A0ACB9BSD2_9ASTR|nr:hypothetical protein L1987_64591 [Smallanthus sonchifolius]